MNSKDLFVLPADTDAAALLKEVLARHEFPGVRKIQFTIGRPHPLHDSGIVNHGPELVRELVRKDQYRKVILLWDYEGSGCETKKPRIPPEKCQERVVGGLARVSWKDNSTAIVIVPELEEWLWRDPASIRKHLGLNPGEMEEAVDSYTRKANTTPECIKSEKPKELLQHLFRLTLQRKKALPDDFRKIAARANLKLWCASTSFQSLVTTLAAWFPQ